MDRINSHARQEVLLTEYSELRKEIRSRSAMNQRYIVRGLGLSGLIAGYALYSDSEIFISIIPLVLVFTGTAVLKSLSDIYLLGRRVKEIESELPSGEQMWEHRYGAIATEPEWSYQPFNSAFLVVVFGTVIATMWSLAILLKVGTQYFIIGIFGYSLLAALSLWSFHLVLKTKNFAQEKVRDYEQT